MAEIIPFRSRQAEDKALLDSLSPEERGFAELFLQLMLHYEYRLSGFPPIHPPPAPGVPSAAAAAKAMVIACIKAGRELAGRTDR